MALGHNIRDARGVAGMSQRELADRAGLGPRGSTIISAMEQRDSVRSVHAPAIARALGISLDELLSGKVYHAGYPTPPPREPSDVAEAHDRYQILADLPKLVSEAQSDAFKAAVDSLLRLYTSEPRFSIPALRALNALTENPP